MRHNHVWAIVIQRYSFGRKKIQISRHVHRQVTNHSPWYIFIGKLIVCNYKTLFYQYVVTISLRNIFMWILIIHFYSHIIAKFIHNLFNLAVTFNAFNKKYCFVVMYHNYIQSPVALFFCSIGRL